METGETPKPGPRRNRTSSDQHAKQPTPSTVCPQSEPQLCSVKSRKKSNNRWLVGILLPLFFVLALLLVYWDDSSVVSESISTMRAVKGLTADALRHIADCIEGAHTIRPVRRRLLEEENPMDDGPTRSSEDQSPLWDRLAFLEDSRQIDQMVAESYATSRLKVHNDEFPKKTIRNVVENVYVAVGYGLANVVLIDTPEGYIIIDTLESKERMHEVMTDWTNHYLFLNNNISTSTNSSDFHKWGKKVLAVFFSHFHSDHVFGAIEVVEPDTQIWAHRKTANEMGKVFSLVAGITYKRSMKQFGTLLTEQDGFINAGIGPRLFYSNSEPISKQVNPTHIWDGDMVDLTIGGVNMLWKYAPGESKDQVICWIETHKLLFAADNIYKSFPNIYAIRGTESRDPMVWVKTLDMLRKFDAEHMVLGHTLPVSGKEEIQSLLTVYRDAIQFIHDQTIRRMNQGMEIDDIVNEVKLPPHLRDHPWLEPFYGTVEWTTRAVFHHYLGWFSGSPEDLNPLSKNERAVRLRKLAGSQTQLALAALEALENQDWQWALELASAIIRLNSGDIFARKIRILALKALASVYISAPGRNWMLTTAKQETEELEDLLLPTLATRFVKRIINPLDNVDVSPRIKEGLAVTLDQRTQAIQSLRSSAETFEFLPVRLNAEKALKMDVVMLFKFIDKDEAACVHIRRGVAYSAPECEREPTLVVETTDGVWRRILTKQLSPVLAVSTGRFRLVPQDLLGYLRLKYILSLVDFEDDVSL